MFGNRYQAFQIIQLVLRKNNFLFLSSFFFFFFFFTNFHFGNNLVFV